MPVADVSVIIVCWNSGSLLAQCLESLLAQTVRPNAILVIDNASVDNSAEIGESFPEVTVHRMPTNLGFAAANNYAIDRCSTAYVALLNPDAFPEPDWLESLLKAAKCHPEAASFGSRQVSAENSQVLDGVGDVYHVTGLAWRRGYGEIQAQQYLQQSRIFAPCAAAALYRRDALLLVGKFDEDYFCYMEDVDLGFRLRLAGFSALYIPDAVVRHVGSAFTGVRSAFSVYHGHRNMVWTFIKNVPGILLWILIPGHLLLNLVMVLMLGLRGQGGIALKAKKDAFHGLHKMWRKRTEIQHMRVAGIWEIFKAMDKSILLGR